MNLVKLLYLKCIKWWNDYMNRAVSRGIAGMGAHLDLNGNTEINQAELYLPDMIRTAQKEFAECHKLSTSACYDPSLQTSASAAIPVRPGANVTIIKR
jgi:hypothetical protein